MKAIQSGLVFHASAWYILYYKFKVIFSHFFCVCHTKGNSGRFGVQAIAESLLTQGPADSFSTALFQY